MVESTAFFEAYRHVLEGLKEIDPAELPFQVTYLCHCFKPVYLAQYITRSFIYIGPPYVYCGKRLYESIADVQPNRKHDFAALRFEQAFPEQNTGAPSHN